MSFICIHRSGVCVRTSPTKSILHDSSSIYYLCWVRFANCCLNFVDQCAILRHICHNYGHILRRQLECHLDHQQQRRTLQTCSCYRSPTDDRKLSGNHERTDISHHKRRREICHRTRCIFDYYYAGCVWLRHNVLVCAPTEQQEGRHVD
jgi:hypothetical protein